MRGELRGLLTAKTPRPPSFAKDFWGSNPITKPWRGLAPLASWRSKTPTADIPQPVLAARHRRDLEGRLVPTLPERVDRPEHPRPADEAAFQAILAWEVDDEEPDEDRQEPLAG